MRKKEKEKQQGEMLEREMIAHKVNFSQSSYHLLL
jgi:hypothetical protein